MTLKIDVLTLMPSANVTSAVTVNVRLRARARTANRMSFAIMESAESRKAVGADAADQESRSATTGSTDAARRAGSQLPNNATAARITATAVNVSGSFGLTS